MIKLLIKYGWCIYLGFFLGYFGDINVTSWRFHAIVIPLIILINLAKDLKTLDK